MPLWVLQDPADSHRPDGRARMLHGPRYAGPVRLSHRPGHHRLL